MFVNQGVIVLCILPKKTMNTSQTCPCIRLTGADFFLLLLLLLQVLAVEVCRNMFPPEHQEHRPPRGQVDQNDARHNGRERMPKTVGQTTSGQGSVSSSSAMSVCTEERTGCRREEGFFRGVTDDAVVAEGAIKSSSVD